MIRSNAEVAEIGGREEDNIPFSGVFSLEAILNGRDICICSLYEMNEIEYEIFLAGDISNSEIYGAKKLDPKHRDTNGKLFNGRS